MEKYTGKPILSRETIIKLTKDVGTDVIYRNTPIVNCEIKIIFSMFRVIHTKLRNGPLNFVLSNSKYSIFFKI
uniref:Uncharacterized protein n=1 Tax=Lepeophtheirus salmonis TaxID=72036 RepID=A0A0K2USG6_LEPSM